MQLKSVDIDLYQLFTVTSVDPRVLNVTIPEPVEGQKEHISLGEAIELRSITQGEYFYSLRQAQGPEIIQIITQRRVNCYY